MEERQCDQSDQLQKKAPSSGKKNPDNDNQLESRWNNTNVDVEDDGNHNQNSFMSFEEQQQYQLPSFYFQQDEEDLQQNSSLDEYDFDRPATRSHNSDHFHHEHEYFLKEGEGEEEEHQAIQGCGSFDPLELSQATAAALEEAQENVQELLQEQQNTRNENRVVTTFIAILLTILAEKSPKILSRVQQIIKQCTMSNRSGHPDYKPLIDALRTNLYPVVGERHWSQCERCTRRYMEARLAAEEQQQQQHHMMTTATSASTPAYASSLEK